MDRDGSGSRVISGSLDRDAIAPRWAPDGGGIYFLSDDKGNTGLYFCSLDGNPKQLARNVGSGASAYGGGGAYTVARNGDLDVSHCRLNTPLDIVIDCI